MKLTGVAILVLRGMKVLQAAPAAYPYRSAREARMNVASVIAEVMAGWTHVPGPADPADVAEFSARAPIPLPAEYLALLRLHDGGEGELGADPGWFCLWPTAEVLTNNQEYQ